MLVIANNITTRNAQVDQQLRRWKEGAEAGACSPAEVLEEMARQCVKAGADILEINIQQHHDRPEVMEFAVKAVQQVTDRQLCLSSNNPEALEAGLRICKRPPLVDYVSVEEARLRQVLPLVARHGADVVLLITDPAALTDAQGMLKKAAVLVGAANESGIANRSILIDPGLLHVTSEAGQRHLVEVAEFLRALPEIFDPPVGSTCWLSNSSALAPWR
ncbi:MAG: dihydropteroate synthase, partial [Chloroflexota bacterium]|nr:dihydropteroate synthase [Chloroflexota bacterium]